MYNQFLSNYFADNYFADVENEADNLFGSRKRKKAEAVAALGAGVANAKQTKLAAKTINKVNRKADRLDRKSLKASQKSLRKKDKADVKRTVAREKVANTIEHLAKRDEKPLEEVALKVIESKPEYKENIEQYVVSKGEQPLNNTAELATQAYLLRQQEIAQVAEAMPFYDEETGEEEIDYDFAQELLEEAEEAMEEENNADADNFIGSIVAALEPIAKKGLAKIAEKKRALGKKGLFVQLDNKINGGDADAAKGTMNDAAKAAYDKMVAEKKKEEIKKMLPAIIGGALAFAVIIFFIARATKK